MVKVKKERRKPVLFNEHHLHYYFYKFGFLKMHYKVDMAPAFVSFVAHIW